MIKISVKSIGFLSIKKYWKFKTMKEAQEYYRHQGPHLSMVMGSGMAHEVVNHFIYSFFSVFQEVSYAA